MPDKFTQCENHEDRITRLEKTVYDPEQPANSIAIRLDRIEQNMLIGLWVIGLAAGAFITESMALLFVVLKNYAHLAS